MSSQPPLEVLISVRPRLFATVLGRLLDSGARRVTVIDPDDQAVDKSGYDVAVTSDSPGSEAQGAAVIWLPQPGHDRPAGTVRIGSQHEIVRVSSPTELVALIDRAGTEARQQGRG